ncbi:MAG: lysophospholipid acyltransferase family protein [Gemmatimonadales bacterium]
MSASLASLAGRALRWIAALLARTWRLEVVGVVDPEDAPRRCGPVIYAVPHGQTLAPLWHRRHRGITLLVSGHRDGRLVAAAASRWGYDIASGSSTRGGTSGLLRIVRALRRGLDAAFTPDGPRGPRGTIKPGVVAAAQLSGASIVPVGVHASRAWRLGSWDLMTVPQPFARVRIIYGEPIRVASGRAHRRAGMRRLALALEFAERKARCGA